MKEQVAVTGKLSGAPGDGDLGNVSVFSDIPRGIKKNTLTVHLPIGHRPLGPKRLVPHPGPLAGRSVLRAGQGHSGTCLRVKQLHILKNTSISCVLQDTEDIESSSSNSARSPVCILVRSPTVLPVVGYEKTRSLSPHPTRSLVPVSEQLFLPVRTLLTHVGHC